jgi:serine/threonine-protein kinase RIO1
LSVQQSEDIFEQAVGLAARLAKHGLVHCDLNEFNLMVDLSGIQALATAKDDPYVRNSGQSVVTAVTANTQQQLDNMSVGKLSKPAWEQSLEENDRIQEALPEPAARLESGEPKPIVTLIDFPQMISTKHPNAQEMYERDMACLRRFF